MKGLNNQLVFNRTNNPVKVLQFGAGNFLRAYVNWMIEILNEKTDFQGGVAIVKPTPGDYELLKDQDGLFNVFLRGVVDDEQKVELKLITCVQEVVSPYLNWEGYLNLAKYEDIRFVFSNTTEAGIVFNRSDSKDDIPPKEFPGKLTLWLFERYKYFSGADDKGCIFFPCELITDNGAQLKECILKYADHWKLDPDFKEWVVSANTFCNTLVDRIVSGYPEKEVERIEGALGYKDELLVSGEYFHNFFIEVSDRAVEEEIPFNKTDLNVRFVEDLEPFRAMKIYLLNGAHTSMVPLGLLTGKKVVEELMEDEELCAFIKNLLYIEIMPVIGCDVSEARSFAEDTLNRFHNPFIEHHLSDISLNSISKFRVRLLPSLKNYQYLKGRLPERIVFVFAALILFYRGNNLDNKEEIQLKDNPEFIEFFKSLWEQFNCKEIDLEHLIGKVLQNENMWGEDLNKIEGLSEQLCIDTNLVLIKGVVNALKIKNSE